MTARSTRPTTTRLWTGATALLLLLVIGSAGSQGATTTLDEAAASRSPEVIAESPEAGSVDDPLRKVDASAATLRDVEDKPSDDSAKPSKNAERVDITDGRPVGKSEKPSEPTTKIGKNDGKPGSKSSKREFSENEDNGSSDDVESFDEFAKKKSNASRVDEAAGSVGKSEKLQTGSVDVKSGTSLPEFGEHEDAGSIDDPDDDEDREPTTQPPRRDVDEGHAPKDLGPKDRETGNAGPEDRGPEIGSSLANDTNVNFNTKKPIKKNEGDLGGDASGSRSHLENATNAIATGGDIADGPTKGKGPKAQVEVVRNTTLPKILRITEAANATKEVDSLGRAEQESVVETTPESVREEKTRDDSTLPSGSDADGEKKGRTISFAGSNEFVTGENKTGGSVGVNGGITDSPVGNVAIGVTAADFRPYPYAKSDRQSNSSSSASTDEASSVVESTEEASALENTIGQSQQDKKFVVTEPSVVIDNSIQQFKPTYYKRSGNTTRIATTSSPMPAQSSSGRRGPSDPATPSTESIAQQGNVTTAFATSSPILNVENDVPRGKSEEAAGESVKDVVKDTGLDLTGNGITEVIAGVRNDSNRVSEDSVTTAPMPLTTGGSTMSGATDDDTDSRSVQNTTEKIVKVNDESTSSVDVQTDPEESMLRISSLNVTEDSTKIDQQATADSTTKAPSSSTPTITTPSLESSSAMNSTTETSSTSASMPSQTLPTSPSVSVSSAIPESTSALMTTVTTVASALNVSSTDSTVTSSPITASISTTGSILLAANTTGASNEKLEEKPTTLSPEESSTVVDLRSPETEEFSPDDRVESTTSKIEYVFVGLTESTASQQYIATSEGPNAVTADREVTQRSHDPSSVVGSSTATTLISVESSTAAAETPEEMVTQPMTLIADNETSEDFTTTDSIVEFTTLENNLATTKDDDDGSESTTTINDPTTTTPTNESAAITTEEVVVVVVNSTDAPSGVSPSVGENTTDTGRAVDPSTNRPEAVDTGATNSSATTGNPAETTVPTITEESPRILIKNATSGWPIEITTTEGSTVDATSRSITSKSGSGTTTMTTTPRTVTSTTENGTAGVVTDGSIEIVHRGGVPSLVKVVFEGSWTDVCPHLDVLRQSLADLLTAGLEKTVLASQIVFQSNPCSSGYAASTGTTETSVTTLLLYVVDENGNFDAEMTKTLPSLYSKSPIKLQVIIRSFQLVQDSDSGNAIAVVVVSCVALICLILLAGLLFIMRKRQTRFNYGERCRPVSLDAYSLDSVSAYNSVRRKGAARASKRSYGNPTFEDSSAIPSHPLNFAGLSTFCNEQNAISEEFAGIPQVTARIDELPQGAEVKNRYANVVPLPETRVSLMKINNDPLTEYINASYVRGPKNATKYYIACQAPIESTVTDFWRMIWEQQSKVVIMLTDLVENGVEKCAEYVPPSEVTDCHRLFGDFQVTLKKRETKEKYAISTLHLKNLENNTFREISHIWYLWPANGVQSDAAGLIAVLLEARALQRGGPGPIVVHCSPGTGRTGTLIALDLGIRQYEITRTVDVPRVVYTIRRDRAGAVQTKEQYAFIYKALNLYATKLAGGALDS